jgi:predicted nucleic acid-binding protein
MSAFFDTNIVLYSLLDDNFSKSEKAIGLMAQGGIISVQVLNEMVSVLRGRKKWDWAAVGAALDASKTLLDVREMSVESQGLAVEIAQRFGYSIYDANILASAKLSGCDTLWSEDMAHGQVINGVTIINPFVDMSSA